MKCDVLRAKMARIISWVFDDASQGLIYRYHFYKTLIQKTPADCLDTRGTSLSQHSQRSCLADCFGMNGDWCDGRWNSGDLTECLCLNNYEPIEDDTNTSRKPYTYIANWRLEFASLNGPGCKKIEEVDWETNNGLPGYDGQGTR